MATATKTAAKAATKKAPAKQAPAKKAPAKGKADASTQHCWPGYEPVPGMAAGEKGSCKPKPNQTAAEKKGDAKAAAASKLQKAGGNKAKANKG